MGAVEAARPETRLHVFISYASEDAALAKAINSELRAVFSPGVIKTTLDTELKLGVAWRERLEQELNNADVLLIVATGRQKLSHSFTGFEVGYFTASKKTRARMAHFDSERLIIPIAIFSDIPDPVSDVEGLDLDDQLTPLLVDPEALKDRNNFLRTARYDDKANPVLRLFKRFQEIILTSGYHKYSPDELEYFEQRTKDCSKRLHETIFEELQKRIFIERFGERKITVRLQADDHGDPFSKATLEFLGGSFEVFGFYPRPGVLSWNQFISAVPSDNTATAWKDIIGSLIADAKAGDFRENRRLLASADQTRFFRLFVSRSVLYYSGVTELHIHIVEVKSRDYGDPKTTMLVKAISVGMRYRFLFLEPTSEFSPAAFNLTLANELPRKVSALMQELDHILWLSNDASLSRPENLLAIYGGTFRHGELDERFSLWERQKTELYDGIVKVIGAAAGDDLMKRKREFLQVLESFCDTTREMNQEFVNCVLHVLQQIVAETDPTVSLHSPNSALATSATH